MGWGHVQGGSYHYANDGSWYVSSTNICNKFGKKGGHLLGNATSLPPWLSCWGSRWAMEGEAGWDSNSMRGPSPEREGGSSLSSNKPQELPSTSLPTVCSRGSHHFANGGSQYVSSNNICKCLAKKGIFTRQCHLLASVAFPAGPAGGPWIRHWQLRVGLGGRLTVDACGKCQPSKFCLQRTRHVEGSWLENIVQFLSAKSTTGPALP